MPDNATQAKFRHLSSFVGGLLRLNAIEKPAAQEMLVAGFWEIEAEAAYQEEGEDLLAFAKDYCASKGLIGAA